MKIAFLGNYTQELIVKQFEKELLLENASIYIAGYNQYKQEIINEKSLLYSDKPGIIYLSIDLYSLLENLLTYDDNVSQIKDRIQETISLIKMLCSEFPNSQVFVDNFFFFRPILMATLEYNSNRSFYILQNSANDQLIECGFEYKNLKIIDVLSLVINKGSEKLFDERLHYLSKNQWSFSGIKELSLLYKRYYNAFIGKTKKCLVLDLDNTLWGGIIGDDGIKNILLSNDGLGKAYYDFQKEILKLYNRGIILAVCSKNSPDLALDAIENHPHMILRKEHFIKLKINWDNKAQNIKDIAKELNIGLNSIVFLDDSPFERDMVARNLPEVEVPNMPTEAADYPNFIRKLQSFDFLELTNDDFIRNNSYKANVRRQELKNENINLEDFYYSLGMIASIDTSSMIDISRVSQLTQKTNQFNLRTKRYTAGEIVRFIEVNEYKVYQMALDDKYGSYGIISCAIVKIESESFFIDTFILSCRAMGRTAETVLLNYIIEDAIENQKEYVIGEYIQSKKNMPCKDFYKEHNFSLSDNDFWKFDLNNEKKIIPWIEMK